MSDDHDELDDVEGRPYVQDVTDESGLVVIPADEDQPPPRTPDEALINGLVRHTADVFSHLSFALNEHRKYLPAEWWSYFPILCAAALKAYYNVFERDVPDNFMPIVEAMSKNLGERATEHMEAAAEAAANNELD